ncbi:hypothetical protein HHK36_006140 [Tetracentron sinense]|uniref:ADP-ribosylation factor GTPase-activating protein AGD14 n=1 Tax=Tetracentron sinense TaxID=13715 RepID=A0A834ZKU6_TETSI|nr:hypothetical protein HHK36_006140 [Tetracentron sinense]
MANRMKEDERNERTIRGLLKLPENRRCINCNSLCFIASREFTHRVKSVSMAKFTSQEVSSLQGGGNERAKEIYFKEWDSQRHSVPDSRLLFFFTYAVLRISKTITVTILTQMFASSNVDRLRDFIKHAYVDRRYTGERSSDKPPTVKMGDREDSYENRRADPYGGGSRSPPYEDTYERRYSERSGPGGRNDDRNFRISYDQRSPGYDQENQRYGDYRSPVRSEVVDDKRRDDRFGNGRRYEERRFSDGESKLEGRSPDHQKDLDMSSPPLVRPVRDILGENAPPLRISEPPKANGGRVADGSAQTQDFRLPVVPELVQLELVYFIMLRTASSSSLGSIDGKSVELRGANSVSLIDFNDDPEPPVSAAATPPPPIGQSVMQPTSLSIDGGNWASFDVTTQETVSQAPSNANTLESVLSQLSAPAPLPVGKLSAIPNSGVAPATDPVGNMSMLPMSGGAQAAPVGHMSTLPYSVGAPAPVPTPVSNISMLFPSGNAPAAAPGGMAPMHPISGGVSFLKATDARQSIQQQHPSLFPATDSRSTAQQFTPPVGGASNNQPWGSPFASNAQGFFSTAVQASQAVSKPAQDTSSGIVSQQLCVEAKASGRKELPEDLFAPTYSSVLVPGPGWQTGAPRGMGFNMQYPTGAPMPTFPHSSKSINPFDLHNEPTLVHAPTFPSMASLQGALPNMSAPASLLRTSSLGTPSPRWMPPQSPSYASVVPPHQSPSYTPAMPLHQSPSYTPAMPPHQAPSYTPVMPPHQAQSYTPAMPPQSLSYASAMPPQSQSYAAMPPSAYMGQQLPSNMPTFGHQGIGGYGSDGAVFGTLNTNQQLAGRFSAPATPNSFSSVGGNPFG